MSDPPRPLLRVQELLREQRYRRSFLHDDRRQHARILAILGAAMTAVLVNDIRLLRDSAWLHVALLIRLAILVSSAVSALRLLKVERPAQQDRKSVV